ncbi:MAG TPA: rRNA maturation RNase YbeY [Chitinophagaceae bacterium]|nr:rRNA maturation RNase YbeY [Chitinophagaceae bacterium]
MASQSKVCFFFEKKDFTLCQREHLKAFIQDIFKKEKKKLESLNYIFCSDKKILEINRRFLNHDYYTDIISFDLSEDVSTKGEIYISIDRIKENAHILGTSFKFELLRVIFHGTLHLCGYEDKTKEETQKMRDREEHYLTKYDRST